MNGFLPRSLKGQLIAAMVFALLISQMLGIAVLLSDRKSALRAEWLRNIVVRTGSIIELVEATPPEFQDQILRTSATNSVRYGIASEPTVVPGSVGDEVLAQQFRLVLADKAEIIAFKVYPVPEASDRLRQYLREWVLDLETFFAGGDERAEQSPRRIYTRLSIKMKDGRWLNVTVAPRPHTPPAWPLVVQMMAAAVLAGLGIILVINRMTRPLKNLAVAAAALGRGEQREPLVEAGPAEVSETIRAFNDMQDRLTRFVYDRTKMLAAIGHDLRTPITSLRLRAEFIEDEEIKAKILETLDEMQQMAETTLSFAREEAGQEETRLVDLSALAGSVCDDLFDSGLDVRLDDCGQLPVKCRPMGLKRAVRNVVENAVAYGQRARVSIERRDEDIVIFVDDNGPGIPLEDIEKVFKPFVRLESSRSRQTGGVGLGLAIARSILRAHGGDVTLCNRPGGGLRAALSLPLSMNESKAADAGHIAKQAA